VSKYDFDLFVIGAGSGGVRAGRLAAQLGKRVGVAEESKPGGRAEFVDKHTVRLTTSGKTVTAKTILIAVGGRPWMPKIKGYEHAIMSDDAFLLEALPERVLIIGGGYIASEFAGIYAGMGVKTVQAYRGASLLNGFDPDVREETTVLQENNGIDVRFNISPTEIKKTTGGYIVSFDDGSKIGTDLVFMATGRKPHTSDLGLENAGVEVDQNGAVKVDKYSKTSASNIYAVGDVTNRVNLTPVAIREGAAFIETVFKGNKTAYDHTQIASAVFTRPPIGVVGYTEPEARKKFKNDMTVYTTSFRPMKNVLAGKPQKCFMKLITQGTDEVVIGIHIVGDDSPEIIQALGICVKAGLTKKQFDETCAVHPTLAEEIVTLKPRD